jgi:hypothetical protein
MDMRFEILDMRYKSLKLKAEGIKPFLSFEAVGVSNLKSQISNLE